MIQRLHGRIENLPVVILAITIVFYFFAIFNWNTTFPGDLGDARFNQFVLEHVTRWLAGKEQDLFNPPLFYPFQNALFFSDTHFGTALLYAAPRYLGASRETAFNIWFFCGQLGSFLAAFIVLRRWSLSISEAFIGAFIFAFSLIVLAQNTHAQLSFRMAVPFAFDAFFRWQNKRRTDDGIEFLIWMTLQVILSIYNGLFLALCLGVFYIVKLAAPEKVKSGFQFVPPSPTGARLSIGSKLLVLFALAIFLLWQFYYYYNVTVTYGLLRYWSDVLKMVPQPASFLIADLSPLWSWLGVSFDKIPQRQEHQLFPGLATLTLLILSILTVFSKPSENRFAQVNLIALAGLFLISLNIAGLTLYSLVSIIAGFNALRAITRIYLVLLFPIAILGCFALHHIRKTQPGAANLLALYVSIIFCLETLTFQNIVTDVAHARSRVDVIARDLDNSVTDDKDIGLISVARPNDFIWASTLDVMILAQDRQLKSLSGYSGNYPSIYVNLWDCKAVDFYINRLKSDDILARQVELDKLPPRKIITLPTAICPEVKEFP